MNSWGNEQYMMSNMMSMPQMMQNVMPSNAIAHNAMQPLAPPLGMLGEYSMNGQPDPNIGSAPFIGPVAPEIQDNVEQPGENETEQKHKSSSQDNRSDRRDRDRNRDRGRRARSRDRDRNDRHSHRDRSRSDRREKRSKWDNSGKNTPANMPGLNVGNMLMPGNMMQYSSLLGQQQMEMLNMSNMTNMQPITTMQNIPMMQNMIDQNMMMMNQPMAVLPNQPIYISSGVLMPPIPGISMPSRRERPPGCRTIFVGGLPTGVSEESINEMFQRFGTIDDIKLHKQGVCHVRFEKQETVEQTFLLSGYRFKYHEQMDNEATTIFIDYALNRDDQNEFEKYKRKREPTPPRVEPFSPAALNAIVEKIKSDNEFAEAAPTLAVWLERGECNKKTANTFYSLIQASNNQIRRLFNEKMQVDEEFQTMKSTMKDKYAHILMQFEQVAKILSAAKHQRVSDHFAKQQRRNIEMWLKMTEEVENLREEFNANFDDEEVEKVGKNMIPMEKYEELRTQSETLMYELEGYRNEAHLAKDEAERKFEKFKAHFIAQQALQGNQSQHFPPLPPPPMPNLPTEPPAPQPPPPTSQPPTLDNKSFNISGPAVVPSEAKLISLLTAFLMIHPLGATTDYLFSYLKSMLPHVTQATVNNTLQRYNDVFQRKTTGVGPSIEHRWCFATFDSIKTGIGF